MVYSEVENFKELAKAIEENMVEESFDGEIYRGAAGQSIEADPKARLAFIRLVNENHIDLEAPKDAVDLINNCCKADRILNDKLLNKTDTDNGNISGTKEQVYVQSQAQKPAETKQYIPPSKLRRIITWLKNHPHRYSLAIGVIFLILFIVLGLLKAQWRTWCWGTAGIAFLVLIVSLLGGRSR